MPTTFPSSDTLLAAVCPLLVEVARTNSAPVQAQVKVMRDYFASLPLPLRPTAVRTAIKSSLQSKRQDIAQLALRARAQLSPQSRVTLMETLYELALVDGQLTKDEMQALHTVARVFNLSDEQLQRVRALFLVPSEGAYETLGVSSSASNETVRKAFRSLAAQWHPDKPTGNLHKFQEISRAYEEIRLLRGWLK